MKWRGAAIGGGATSGKLGPAVASRNKGGQYLRARVVPSGSTPTPFQEVIRNAVRSTAPSWSSLTPAQRAGWNTYGVNVPVIDRLGDSIQLSGQNWFIGANVLRAQVAADGILEEAPNVFNRGGLDFSGATIVLGASTGTLTLASSPASLSLDVDDVIALWAGRDYSPGRSKYFGSFQLATTIGGNSTATAYTFTLPFAHATDNAMSFNLGVSYLDGRYPTPSRLTVSP
jgi:hypothetical protein